jgi:hypothetical protein
MKLAVSHSSICAGIAVTTVAWRGELFASALKAGTRHNIVCILAADLGGGDIDAYNEHSQFRRHA